MGSPPSVGAGVEAEPLLGAQSHISAVVHQSNLLFQTDCNAVVVSYIGSEVNESKMEYVCLSYLRGNFFSPWAVELV